MKKDTACKVTSVCLCMLMVCAGVMPTYAGGNIQDIDITGRVPSVVPGQIEARTVDTRWDARAIPVKYSANNTSDPIPNPLGPPSVSLADATRAMQASFDNWNNNPASFINMQITGATSNVGLAGFDMVNELTFRTRFAGAFIAVSASTVLPEDVTLDNGDDIDEDGDSDVSSAISVTEDVDRDGDLEFPAGFYKAGTILDNDVEFNTRPLTLPNGAPNPNAGFRFTVDPAAIDTNPRSVDIIAVATHEFGHSHGLAHTAINNQLGVSDVTGATMFPSIDTDDPASELAQRSPETDDLAYSSYYYPEGSASSGPAALQAGDVDFDDAYGLITGELRNGFSQQPIAGGSLFTVVDGNALNSNFVSAISGTARYSFNPNTGQFFIVSGYSVIDGRYVLPVPRGTYKVGVEALDGQPVSGPQVNETAFIGFVLGQQNFTEEFFNGSAESAIEDRPAQAENISVEPGAVRAGVSITTNRTINVNNFGTRNFVGFNDATPGFYYAVRVPVAQVAEVQKNRDLVIQAANYDTNVFDTSVAPVFAEATLTTGVVNTDGSLASLNLNQPLARASGFLAQDNDLAPFYFEDPRDLGQTVRQGIANGSIQNLFIVLRVPLTAPFPGVNQIPPRIYLDGIPGGTNDVPIFGLSYTSTNGVTFTRDPRYNFRFSLQLSETRR